MYRFLLIPALVASSVTAVSAQKLAALQAGRYTRQGTNVLVESGILKAPGGFIPDKATTYPESAFSVHGMTAASITAINGKVVAFKATIDLYQQTNPGFLDNYSFSKQSYPTAGGASYIVTLAGAGTVNAPTATVKASKTTLTEGPKATATFDITLSKAATTDTAVVFVLSGTAKSVYDYVASTNLGFVKIKKGKKTASVKITLRDDKLKEPTEKLTLTMKPHASYKLGSKKSATITIKDNDK
ncbi:MAG: hypothetical protein EOP85_05035 [Verrucomicrobiaceae bacterium]|nr:MAG: hypothetical protein EOP85_05035 [Verrucomicrobiaceae bacterium]